MFFKGNRQNKRIYLDYAAHTPIDRAMRSRIPDITDALAGNPGGLHQEALAAKKVREVARARVAESIGAHPDEIIFTSGATESDNLAIAGVIFRCIESKIPLYQVALLVSELEHPAVLKTAEKMKARFGIVLVKIPAENGIIDPKSIVVPDGARMVLLSVLYIHNELGTIQPITDIAKRVRFLRKQHPDCEILFHVDATQAPLYYQLQPIVHAADLLTIGATKLPTEKGIGVLYVRRHIKLAPNMFGGDQEFGLRPGSEPIQLMHEFSYALSNAQKAADDAREKIGQLQIYFEKEVKRKIPTVRIFGEGSERAVHITHLALPNFDSELLVIELDARGISVSSHSACIEAVPEDAYTKRLYEPTTGVVRFSYGSATTKQELDRAIQALEAIVKKYL